MNAYHKLSVKKIDELIDRLYQIKYYKTKPGFQIPQNGFKSTAKKNMGKTMNIGNKSMFPK